MPTVSTTTQRKLAAQFIGVTNATKENAQAFLKNANYNLDAAVNLGAGMTAYPSSSHMASSDTLDSDSRVMVLQLFKSCFQKRPTRASGKSLKQDDRVTEAESGDSSQHSLPSLSRSRDAGNVSTRQGTVAPASLAPIFSTKDTKSRKTKSTSKSTSKSVLGTLVRYFSSAETESNDDEALSAMFDKLRSGDDETNSIGLDSIEKYTKELGISVEDYTFFVLCEILRVESYGQITREGFIEGWKSAPEYRDSIGKALPLAERHRKYLRQCIDKITKKPRDEDYYKAVYRRAFFAGKDPEQRAVDTPVAMAFWETLFDPAIQPWQTANTDWLDAWKRYLEETWYHNGTWKRSVNKDTWNQTLEFARQTMKDGTLSFWSEDQAWPGVIDNFVAWCRENGIAPKSATDVMDVDGN
ncbi:Cullin binding-domain-containing protein [Podospora didyma]|uniref:Defective in cullin neddylation protein n=1 Tax=Podospora didyma TaxID=330526 RepID=A0AAE0KE99_9PEZI|nr:Cullin binding-domain-containing protein [Podospora didyma]